MDDLAGGQHHRHGPHIVPGGAVLHRPHAAGVGGHVAPQGGELLAGIGGIEETLLGGVLRQVVEQHARLDPDHHVLGVVGEDLVHLGGGQNHAAVDGHRAASEAGAGAPGGDGHPVLVAQLHDGGHLLGGQALRHHLGHGLAVDGHFVVGKVLVDVPVHADPAGHGGLQGLNQLGGDLVVLAHKNAPLYLITSHRICLYLRTMTETPSGMTVMGLSALPSSRSARAMAAGRSAAQWRCMASTISRGA